jgi:hypothetical protein
MTAATLSHDTMTPMLPFDFDFAAASKAASDARDADRELCRRYLGTWTGTFGSTKRDTSVSFDDFAAAAARLAV